MVKWIPPIGFKTVSWGNLSKGQEVFILGSADDKAHAYGPHVVEDADRRVLRNSRGQTFMHYPDLLVKVGNES